MSKRRKDAREKDLTSRYLSGDFDEDRLDQHQKLTSRLKQAAEGKILRTALLRAAEDSQNSDMEQLPVGEVVQVYSLYSEVEHEGVTRLCVVRKTLAKLADSAIVVGDRVRFRDTGLFDESGRPEAVIEQVLERQTVLTRSDSFKAMDQQPIVANAQQMLIVVSLRQPTVKWGLVDRMIVAAKSGGLAPLLCLNKVDLGKPEDQDVQFAAEALAHYRALGIPTFQSSVDQRLGIDPVREALRDRVTVLAGHSGVGKSSLIRAVQPSLDLRVGHISTYTGKGMHTTTSARRYPLDVGGAVIDTPGVKLFGLWAVSSENLAEYFPDVQDDTAPTWRRDSFERILQSLL